MKAVKRAWIMVVLVPLAACVQSVHSGTQGGTPLPGGTVRLLEERPGRGRPVLPGDRIRVDLIGTYMGGEEWGRGPLTLVFGTDTYKGAVNPVRVGSAIRLQYVVDPNDTTTRLLPFPGLDTKNEAYQVRRDRGQIIVEHRVASVCRPLKIFFLQTGFGPIEMALGCWPLPRFAPAQPDSRSAAIERLEKGLDEPDHSVVSPQPAPRAPADTSRYLDDYGLHRAAREGRPEIVGLLIARGRDPSAVDTAGFQPIHYVGWAQRPLQRFVPALEQSYVDVIDTLLAHGVDVDAKVEPAARVSPTYDAHEQGQSVLSFAAPECADRLVARLLERGANPNALDSDGAPVITGAARNGCPEVVRMLLAREADVNADPQGGGRPLERLIAVSAFHAGHLAVAKLLVDAGAIKPVAAERLKDRLADPGPGGFGFSNRPMARRILKLLR